MEEKRQFPRISVVIPALNEAPNLRHVLPLIPWFVHEIILVDGYSTDDTVAVVEQLRPTMPSAIHIIEQRGKDPQTAAKIVLERLLKQGRDPFEAQILLTVPYGHAEYFARFGNYETLPTLAD